MRAFGKVSPRRRNFAPNWLPLSSKCSLVKSASIVDSRKSQMRFSYRTKLSNTIPAILSCYRVSSVRERPCLSDSRPTLSRFSTNLIKHDRAPCRFKVQSLSTSHNLVSYVQPVGFPLEKTVIVLLLRDESSLKVKTSSEPSSGEL